MENCTTCQQCTVNVHHQSFACHNLHSQDDLDKEMGCIGFACCRSCCALQRTADLWMVSLVSPTMRSRCCAKPTTSSLPSSWASMSTQHDWTSSSPRSACHVFKCLYADLFSYVGRPSMSASTADGAEAQDLMHHQRWQCSQLWLSTGLSTSVFTV